jgi:hypothetical protein
MIKSHIGNGGNGIPSQHSMVLQHWLEEHRPPQWVIAGKAYTILEFAQLLFGDTAQRTEFLLKYSDPY